MDAVMLKTITPAIIGMESLRLLRSQLRPSSSGLLSKPNQFTECRYVDAKLDKSDLDLSIDEFSERHLKPYTARLAFEVNHAIGVSKSAGVVFVMDIPPTISDRSPDAYCDMRSEDDGIAIHVEWRRTKDKPVELTLGIGFNKLNA